MRRHRYLPVALLALTTLAWFGCGDGPVGPLLDETIDGDGGVVDAPGIRLAVPAGAVPDGTTITVNRSEPGDLPPSVAFPDDSLVAGTLFDFGPDGLTFAAPATLTLDYDPDLLPPGTDERRLRVARIDTAYALVPVTARDTVNNRISVEVDHFTFFGILVPRLVPDFTARIDVEETIGVIDAVSEFKALEPVSIEVMESVTVADAPGVDAPGLVRIEVNEALSVADAFGTDAPGVVRIAVEETIGVSDEFTRPGSNPFDLAERITITEDVSIDAIGAPSVGSSESISVTDVVDVRVLPPTKIYVGSAFEPSLGVFDSDLESLGSVTTSGRVARAVRRPGSDEIWVAEREGDNLDSLTVVDAVTDTRIATLYSQVLDPIALDFDASGATVAVADNNADRFVVFDAETRTRIGLSITDFGIPRLGDIQLSADGSTAWAVGNNVARVDVATGTALGLGPVGGLTFASEAVLTPDESELWVIDSPSGNIVVYDANSLAVLDSLPLFAGPGNGEESLVFDDTGTTAYATSGAASELLLYDVATRSELTRIAAGVPTAELALDLDRSLVYIRSRATNDEVVVIDLTTSTVSRRIPFTAPRALAIYR